MVRSTVPIIVPIATCSATDALSGIAAPCTVMVTASGTGYVAKATAVDRAGNTPIVSVSYHVVTVRQWLANLAAQLRALTVTGTDQSRRNDAVTALTIGQTVGWWDATSVGPNSANGTKVFNSLHDAVDLLSQSSNPNLRKAAADVLALTRSWAVKAIGSAAVNGVRQANVTKAQAFLPAGDARSTVSAADAVDSYRQAWRSTALIDSVSATTGSLGSERSLGQDEPGQVQCAARSLRDGEPQRHPAFSAHIEIERVGRCKGDLTLLDCGRVSEKFDEADCFDRYGAVVQHDDTGHSFRSCRDVDIHR